MTMTLTVPFTKNLTQGATEVTISRVKMTQIFLQCIIVIV